MRASKPKTKATWSAEVRQEHTSLLQLALAWKDWNPGQFKNDIGIDQVFDICDDGEPAKLVFCVQAKSTPTIERLRRKGTVKYELEVEHLKRWEDYNPPVVVVLWGTEDDDGCWIDVPAALRWLKEHNSRWRLKSRVTIPIPAANTCRGPGRAALRRRIGELHLPMLARGKECVFTFKFRAEAEDQVGLEHHQALLGTILHGAPSRIPGAYVQMVMPDWYERAVGAIEDIEWVEFSEARSPSELPLTLQAVGKTRIARVPVVLRNIRGGLRTSLWSNEHQKGAVTIEVLFDKGASAEGTLAQYKFMATLSGPTVHGALQALDLHLAAREAGGFAFVWPNGRRGASFAFETDVDPHKIADLERVLRKLAYIEDKVDVAFDLSHGIPEWCLPGVEVFYARVAGDPYEESISFLVPAKTVPRLLKDASSSALTVKGTMHPFDLLGVSVPGGEYTGVLKDREQLLAQLKAAKKGKPVRAEATFIMTATRVALPPKTLARIPVAGGPDSPLDSTQVADLTD